MTHRSKSCFFILSLTPFSLPLFPLDPLLKQKVRTGSAYGCTYIFFIMQKLSFGIKAERDNSEYKTYDKEMQNWSPLKYKRGNI